MLEVAETRFAFLAFQHLVAVGLSRPPYFGLYEGGGDVVFVLAVGILPADEVSSPLFLFFVGGGTDFGEHLRIFGVGGEVAKVGGLVGGGFGVFIDGGGSIVVVIVMRNNVVFVVD